MNKLFLLDAYALIYRSYYALMSSNFYSTKMKINTGAIHGFMMTLNEIIKKENPTHIGVAFDHGKTFRHEAYPPYKAQRQETPEDIKVAVPVIKSLLEALRIPCFQVDGYEADDIIGTLATVAGSQGIETYMLTPDKDYAQLVSEHVKMYKPGFKGGYDVLGVEEICQKYSISSAKQVIDLLALMGDSADNFPGCPGVGEKTAVKLISQYGSCEGIIEHASEIKGALGKKVQEHIDDIKISRFLAEICTDIAEVKDNFPTLLSEMERHDADYDKLIPLLNDLELRTVKKNFAGTDVVEEVEVEVEEKVYVGDFFGEPQYEIRKVKKIKQIRKESTSLKNINTSSSPVAKAEENKALNFTVSLPSYSSEVIETEEGIKNLCDFLLTTETLGFHLETTDGAPMNAEIMSVAFFTADNRAVYIPMPENLYESKKILELLRPVFESNSITKIGHDLKHKKIILHQYGIELGGTVRDVMIAHYIINCGINPKHHIHAIATDAFNLQCLDFDLLKKKTQEELKEQQKNGNNNIKVPHLRDMTLRHLTTERAMLWTTERVAVIYNSWPVFEEKLKSEEGQWELFCDIEMPLMQVLYDMEITGIGVDTEALKEVSVTFNQRLAEHERKIYDMAGEEFTLTNPKKLGEILFEKLHLVEKPKKTKTGQYATGEEILTPLASKHPIVSEILEYKGLKKLINTYVDALPALINNKTGCIHTTFNQCVTTTGRLSSSEPNLQNIPVRGEDGKEIRKCFIAAPLISGKADEEAPLFFSADYSQIELRVMAHMSGDSEMQRAFREGIDIHRATAANVYQKPLEQVTADERSKAKRANFGLIYGITSFGLAQNMGIERSEAKELMQGFWVTFPEIQGFMDKLKQDVRDRELTMGRDRGYTSTLLHRRRYIKDINAGNGQSRAIAEREAMNSPIQGTAADIIKIAMIRIYRRFREEGLQSKMILQVHDELNFSVLPNERDAVERIVLEEMQNAYPLSVPLIADSGWGTNWLEAH